MIVTRPDGAQIAWDATGSGPAVLLVMGLAYPAVSWFRQVPALAQHHRVITVDNRGAGRTGDVAGAPYTVELMTADLLAVLDAAGEEQAHVVGMSMGGLMAQELGLSHPERLLSLALLATHPGITHGVWPEEVLTFLQARATMTPDESREASIPYNYAATTSPQRIAEDWAVRADGTASAAGYAAQGGTALWSGYERLPEMTVRTLLLHGAEDRLVVPANAERIADRVPGAKIVLLQDANHLLTTDQTHTVNQLLLEWFAP
jgi:pimeloyl-ACP methyl ester carboxylesterase